MTKNYWEHPSYGKENHDDKVVTVTLNKTPTADEWVAFHYDYERYPQLDSKFTDLQYCDGERQKNGLDDDWEKTDINPRGLVGFVFKENQVKIWASEAITVEYFNEVVRYTLATTAKSQCFSGAQVTAITANGVSSHHTGSALSEVAATISVAPLLTRCPPASAPRKPQP